MPLRPARFAGSWYPGSRAELEREVDGYLAGAALPAAGERLQGLVVPHAGYVYSGHVAGRAYALLRGRRALRAVLVGPSHREAFDGVAVFRAGEFETPLGRAAIDVELTEALLADEVVRDLPHPHLHEHALEMQLPFLQRLVPELRIVPLLMGSQSRLEVEALARALVRVLRAHDALLIASSDLSHYHAATVASELDRQVVADVEALDAPGLMARLEGFHGHACGGGGIVAVMSACLSLGTTRAAALRYADSGDAGEHDKRRVVGYLAAAFWAPA